MDQRRGTGAVWATGSAGGSSEPVSALNCCDRLLLLEGGEIRSVLRPFADPLEKMEEQLALIYGCVSLHRCMDKSGREQLVMLKENGGWE